MNNIAKQMYQAFLKTVEAMAITRFTILMQALVLNNNFVSTLNTELNRLLTAPHNQEALPGNII